MNLKKHKNLLACLLSFLPYLVIVYYAYHAPEYRIETAEKITSSRLMSEVVTLTSDTCLVLFSTLVLVMLDCKWYKKIAIVLTVGGAFFYINVLAILFLIPLPL